MVVVSRYNADILYRFPLQAIYSCVLGYLAMDASEAGGDLVFHQHAKNVPEKKFRLRYFLNTLHIIFRNWRILAWELLFLVFV